MSDRMSVLTTGQKFQSNPEVGSSLVEVLDRLGITVAHFACRGTADLKGLLSQQSERVASLTVLCPAVLDTPTLAPLGERLLVVTGDHGPGARRVQAGLPDLPRATPVVLDDYAGLTWSDIAAERGDGIFAAIRGFLSRRSAPPSVWLPRANGGARLLHAIGCSSARGHDPGILGRFWLPRCSGLGRTSARRQGVDSQKLAAWSLAAQLAITGIVKPVRQPSMRPSGHAVPQVAGGGCRTPAAGTAAGRAQRAAREARLHLRRARCACACDLP